jgi:membrane associated rhomboid family serine protease
MARWEDSGEVRVAPPAMGPAVKAVMLTLLCIWLMFAAALNWGGASQELFLLFCGNTEAILQGQVWRLFTAPLLHMPSGNVLHLLFSLLGLYFLTPTLERQWGSGRTLRFLFFSALIAYTLQMLVQLILPVSVAEKLVGQYWFGATPALEAVAMAFALTFRGGTVRLMFLVPVSSRGLIIFLVSINLLYVIAAARPTEGLIAPFGGLFAGWLLGAGSPSPLRRAYLQLRLRQLDRQASAERRARSARAKSAPFQVIEGGRGQDPKGRRSNGSGSDGGMLH